MVNFGKIFRKNFFGHKKARRMTDGCFPQMQKEPEPKFQLFMAES